MSLLHLIQNSIPASLKYKSIFGLSYKTTSSGLFHRKSLFDDGVRWRSGFWIEDLEFIEDERVESIVESILFASDRPVSFASIYQVFKGTTVKKEKIRRAIDALAVEYAGGRQGAHQQAFCIPRKRRHHDIQPGEMCKY